MWTRPDRGQCAHLFGLVAVCAFFLSAVTVDGQDRPRRRDRGREIEPIRTSDPFDEAAKAEATLRKAQKYYESGMRFLEKGRLQAAKSKFKTVVAMLGREGLGGAAASQLESLHNEGMSRLAEARNLLKDGKYVQALDLAKETKTRYANLFGGLKGFEDKPNVSRLAVELIKRVEADPVAQIAITEAKAAKVYAKIGRLEELVKRDREKYYDLYKRLKRIAKHYPECPTGERCIERLKQLKADRELYRDIKEEEKRRYIAARFQQAEQYERLGMPERAAKEYEKLKKRFPGQTMKELRKIAAQRPLADADD